MQREKQAAALQARYARLAAQLAAPGLLLHGTISTVRPRRPGPTAAAAVKTYGPYYQWTWKERGKTVTINLAAGQRGQFQKAIANQRRIEQTLARMRAISRRILELTTEGVPKRNR